MKKPKILTHAEAVELKWFCQNVVGVRQDMYTTMEVVKSFDDRLKRLEKTCKIIEKYLDENIEPFAKVDWFTP